MSPSCPSALRTTRSTCMASSGSIERMASLYPRFMSLPAHLVPRPRSAPSFLQLAAFVIGTAALSPAASFTQDAPAVAQTATPAASPVEEPGVAGPATAPGANAQPRRDTPEMIAAALKDIPAPPPGPFGETWESIEKSYKDPEWFRDGKFGIMMHWGIYSVPAHGSEWYVRYMYGGNVLQGDGGGNAAIVKWHTEHFGPPTKFGYKDFLPVIHRGQVGSRRLGRPLQKGRSQIRPGPRRASRRLLQLGQRDQSLQRQELWTQARPGRGSHQGARKSRPKDRHLRSFQLPFLLYPRASRQRSIRPAVGQLLQRRGSQRHGPDQVHARLGRQEN